MTFTKIFSMRTVYNIYTSKYIVIFIFCPCITYFKTNLETNSNWIWNTISFWLRYLPVSTIILSAIQTRIILLHTLFLTSTWIYYVHVTPPLHAKLLKVSFCPVKKAVDKNKNYKERKKNLISKNYLTFSMFNFIHILHILIHIVQKFASLTHMIGDYNCSLFFLNSQEKAFWR